MDNAVYYVYIAIAVVFLALQFSVNKAYQARCGSSIRPSLIFTTVKGLCVSVIFFFITWIVDGQIMHVTPYSLLLAAFVAVFCLAYTLIGFRIFKYGSLSVFTTFLMLGGMILPYIFGVSVLDEQLSVFRVVGVVLLVISLIFPLWGNKQSNDKKGNMGIFVLLCLLVFVLNGLVSIVSKIHSVELFSYETVSPTSFVVLTNLINGILSGIALTITHFFGKNPQHASENDKESSQNCKGFKIFLPIFFLILIGAILDGSSYVLQLMGAGRVAASVMYPLQTGGTVVLSAVAGYLFFKEKPNKMTFIGLCITFVATLLFLG